MARAARAVVAAGLLAAFTGCAHREPPAPDTSPSVALPEPLPVTAPPQPRSGSSAAPPSSSTPGSAASAGAPDPSLLPQTHDRPEASGAAFDARVSALWAAIAADEPERAMPFFFPLGAYQQVKDISDPASDWKRRLVAAYAHDIHALHASLRDQTARATLVGMEVPETRARWVDPGEEYNKIGYYRVFGSRLRYSVDGETRSLEVKSLISWRGEWYVVHLSAIK
jgi:hypothetical protein